MLNLESPDVTYRPIPFWSWNDRLEPDELRRQIQEMHRVGIGGFFMHARGGLQTAYLSDEWMHCVEVCLEEAARLGMNGWLYDENGWPSGFGGGLVNSLGVNYQQKYLRWKTASALSEDERNRVVAWYDENGRLASSSNAVFCCHYDVNPYYVDNMDEGVVHEFIRVTHEFYYGHLPTRLLSAMKGIFTDEPQLSRDGLPWSFVLECEYSKHYGRNLLEELPLLFLDKEGSGAMRIRFWRLCAILFREHFLRQIREWCEAHGWLLTGHHVLEEQCVCQITSNGSIMAQYQYYSIPGMDHLTRCQPNAVAMVQLESAAAQYGQRQILTESFALTGWNCNFTGQRWIFHSQLAHGINLLCQHLEGYSLRGLRKRDYPSSAFYHQPWWGEDYKTLNDAFSRIGMLMAEGEKQTRVLVVHPLSSVWMGGAFGDGRHGDFMGFTEADRYFDDSLLKLTERLDAALINHHYADEIIVEETGSVEGAKLRIGTQRYDYAIVPPVRNLSSHLLKLLKAFQEAGGRVCRWVDAAAPQILHVDGDPAPQDVLEWFDRLPAFATVAETVADAAAFVRDTVPSVSEDGHDAESVLATSRYFSDLDGRSGRLHLFVSTLYEKNRRLRFSLPMEGNGSVETLDVLHGTFARMKGVRLTGGRLEFDAWLGGADAQLFFVPDANCPASPNSCDGRDALFAGRPVVRISSKMVVAKCSPNILTLDRCRYRIGDGEWRDEDVISLQAIMLENGHDTPLAMQFDFNVGEDFECDTPLALLVETPGKFRFGLNGEYFEAQDDGYLFDKAFRRVPLPPRLRHGVNTLELDMLYHQPDEVYAKLEKARKFETEYNTLTFDCEMESVYLAGDFEVRHTGGVEQLERHAVRLDGTFELAPAMAGVDCSDITLNGYPFFAGRAVMEAHVSLTEAEARAARYLRFTPEGVNSWKITVNGVEAGDCFWEPYAVPVAGLLHLGDNVIQFEMKTSLRNMLGPHHLEEGESWCVSTMSFNRHPNFVGYQPPPTNDGYCMVKQGIHDIELTF